MTEIIIVTITSLTIFLIIYHHLAYPLLLRVLGKRKIRSAAIEQPKQQNLPTVTIVIPAYNEEEFIADKIRNLSILDYPVDKLKIIIASDGSTDKTYQVALKTLHETECRHFPVKVINFKKNLGKVGVLNTLIKQIRSDVIALSDVSALISIDALKLAVNHFNDPKIGVVNGNYRLLNPGSEGEKKYWDYQSSIKSNEAQLGSVIGSHGAFYLLRTHLFQTLPADTINDDFIIPMQIVQQGYKSILEPGINAIELEQADDQLDSKRRDRISAGNLQQAARLYRLLTPKYRGTAFTFASGKFLRAFMPYLMIVAFIGCILLFNHHPLFQLMALGQAVIYGQYFLIEGFNIQHSSKILNALNYLIRGHVSGLRGSSRYLFHSMLNLMTPRQLNKTS